ncbi:MAG: hypothetical protein V3S70_06915 [Gammaproteobacteria bacterium]
MIEPVSDYLIQDVNNSAYPHNAGISIGAHRLLITAWIPTTQDETLASSIDKAAEKLTRK